MKKLITGIFFLNLLSLILNPIVNADQSVSAIVSPHASDFQFVFSSSEGPIVKEDDTITYTITYGAKQSASVPTATTLTASWTNATAPNTSNLLDYVNGSASNAYGSIVPIVDLINKTITWTIPSLPQGTTDQTVTFQLRTNSNYTGPNQVNFSVTSGMSNEYVTLPDQTITQTYQFVQPPPGPTATPGPRPTTVPSPTPTPEIPIYNVSINGISGTNATVQVTTNNPSKLTVEYGTSKANLNQTVSTDSFQNVSTLTLPDLKPDTAYYFRIKIIGEDGIYYITEIFTFKTATQALSSLPPTGTAVISANGSVLLSVAFNQNMSAGFALVTSTFPYDVTVSLPENTTFKSLESIVQDRAPINTLEMVQQQPGIYTAHMPTLGSGIYSVVVKSLDEEGFLNEQKIADLRIIPPLSVSDQQSEAPLENARIFLWYFDQASNSYKPLFAGMLGLQTNPGYTDGNGIYSIILPPGRYRAEASALLYDSATVDFTLGKNTGENFPHITLKKDPTNIIALFTVGMNFLIDNLTGALAFLHGIATSSRVFYVVATAATGSLILLTYLFFLLKSHTSLKYVPLFFFIHIDVLLKKHKGKYLFGKVTDAAGMPLSLVRVEIEDANTKTILRHTTTNKSGKFYFLNTFTNSITLLFVKEGFQPAAMVLSENGFPENGLEITLEKGTSHHISFYGIFNRGLKDTLGMLFETSLVISIILELLFFFSYGFAKTLPFLALSVINIILWLFYLKQRSEKSVV